MTPNAAEPGCLPEQELLGSLRLGSSMAEPDAIRLRYEQWVQSHAPALFRYALHLCGQRHLAEDLLQETFTQAWKSVARQRDADKARAWLFAILRHCHARQLRDGKRHARNRSLGESPEAQPVDHQPAPLHTLAEQDSLQAALNRLSPVMRETFLMVFAEGRTCRQTAQSLGIPLGTVLSRLDSARRTLRAALGERPAAQHPHPSFHRQDLPTR